MSFTSIGFIFFLGLSVLVYFSVPLKYRWCVLLVASYVFYVMASPKTFVFLLCTSITTFLCGIFLENTDLKYKTAVKEAETPLSKDEKKALKGGCERNKLVLLLATLIINFGILAFVKYFAVYLDMIFQMLGQPDEPSLGIAILIPLGISFYTFQSMGYLIDVYRGQYKADRNFVKFALFVSFFPQIIQGPISRYDQLANQLYEGHSFDYTRIKFGIQLMLWGYFKKLVIADRLGILVNEVFGNYTQYQGFYIVIAVIAYTVQIYADFSGGMDIARGVAQIFGINLVENFRRPYFATTIPDFWRRWHITLGSWCRDYIFYPISFSKFFGKLGKKSRKIFGDRIGKLFPVIIAQLITYFIIGIWHGAQLKYIAYGAFHATFIIGGIIFEPYINRLTEILRINTKAFSWKLFQIMRTFGIVVTGRYFSRGSSFLAALYMLKNTLVFNPGIILSGQIFELGVTEREFLLLAFCLIFWLAVDIIQENGYSIRKLISEQNFLFRWAIYLTGIMAIVIFGVYGQGYDASAFIYRGF